VRYAFIRDHGGCVSTLCHLLQVSCSGYYAWRERGESVRCAQDRELLGHIQRVHQASRRSYGALKTWKELQAQGIACGKHRVARLRQQAGIEALRKRRFRVTVEYHHMSPAAPNHVRQHFHAPAPDRIWVGDATFIRTRAGFLHLAVLLDLYSRRVVGWAMGERPNLPLAMGALDMAIIQREPKPGLVHHTDQGGLYRARQYLQHMQQHGMTVSMSAKGNAYDNAVAESFFSNLKNELVHHCDFQTREQARAAIFEYIEVFYNRQRRHQTLGYMCPAEFEARNGVSC